MTQTTIQNSSLRLIFCLVLLIISLAGCSDNKELVTASGSVTWQGKVVTSGMVTFYPPRGRPAAGMINQDGTFQINSYKDREGLPPGKYKVCVTAFDQSGGPQPNFDEAGAGRPAKFLVPKIYSFPASSPIDVEVKPDGENEFSLNLPPES